MDYEKLKTDIKQIAEIVSSVPDKFRDKCFELLLTNLLTLEKSDREKGSESADKEQKKGSTPPDPAKTEIPKTTALRVLMQKTSVTNEDLDKLLLFDNGEVHFIREPHDTGITTGQMEWALLLALKNAIEKNELSTDPEQLRSVCQEKGFYDRTNFAKTLKAPRNSKLYKTALVNQGPAQPLSLPGQEALGNLIKRLTGGLHEG